MSSWHSYPKLYNVGHAALTELFNGPVLIEEKVDGSQFSFGMFNGELRFKSKGAIIDINNVEGMFKKGVEEVKAIAELLQNGWTYRGEYLNKPKHNTLCYDRVPNKNIILFDINTAEEVYLPYVAKKLEAERLGFEVVPLLHVGGPLQLEEYAKLLETQSVLGSQKIEGFVIKNYGQFGPDKKVLMGKHVSEAFKEIHHKDWKDRNPNHGDVIAVIAEALKTPARWEKAIQHLKERGQLTNSPKDIGPLLNEIKEDTAAESKDYVYEQLLKWAWPQISRIMVSGFPEYYKNKLLKDMVEGSNV